MVPSQPLCLRRPQLEQVAWGCLQGWSQELGLLWATLLTFGVTVKAIFCISCQISLCSSCGRCPLPFCCVLVLVCQGERG